MRPSHNACSTINSEAHWPLLTLTLSYQNRGVGVRVGPPKQQTTARRLHTALTHPTLTKTSPPRLRVSAPTATPELHQTQHTNKHTPDCQPHPHHLQTTPTAWNPTGGGARGLTTHDSNRTPPRLGGSVEPPSRGCACTGACRLQTTCSNPGQPRHPQGANMYKEQTNFSRGPDTTTLSCCTTQ